MLKEAREFFTGGQKLQESKDTVRRLEIKPRLSSREKDKLTQAKGVGRRHFLKLTATGIGAALVGGVTSGLINRIISSDGQNETGPNLNADAIRQKIREFEAQNYGIVNDETTRPISQYISDLYEATFKREPTQKNVLIIANSFLKEKGLPEEDVPIGEAGIVYYEPGTNGEIKDPIIPVIIYAGKTETNDPSINKLSVFRALIEHESIHAQTQVEKVDGPTTIGTKTFKADRKRGFKWIGVSDSNGGIDGEIGHLFDEMNTQFLAEYLNDPTNQDPIFREMNQSRVYQHSLSTVFVEGARLLRRIYAQLGITPQEIEALHFNAQPKELLEKIDLKVEQLGINLSKPASVILLDLNPKNWDDPTELTQLQELTKKITGETA